MFRFSEYRDMRDIAVTCHACHGFAVPRDRDMRDTTLEGCHSVTLERSKFVSSFKT